jgi:hypothetical protein
MWLLTTALIVGMTALADTPIRARATLDQRRTNVIGLTDVAPLTAEAPTDARAWAKLIPANHASMGLSLQQCEQRAQQSRPVGMSAAGAAGGADAEIRRVKSDCAHLPRGPSWPSASSLAALPSGARLPFVGAAKAAVIR